MRRDRQPTIFIVDDDPAMCQLLLKQLEPLPLDVEAFTSADEFLDEFDPDRPGCLITDEQMPGMTGLELQQKLSRQGAALPVILISGGADARMAVTAMKSAAVHVLKKPFPKHELIECITQALEIDADRRREQLRRDELNSNLDQLTRRERQIMTLVAQGLANKQMARQLHLSEKTIEFHRSKLMKKLGTRSVAELIRFALAAEPETAMPDGRLT